METGTSSANSFQLERGEQRLWFALVPPERQVINLHA